MWRCPNERPTSCPTMISPDRAHAKSGGEMIMRCAERKSFDEPSNEARESRALPGSGILTRCIIRSLVGLRCGGNYLDFHIGSFRQCGNLDSGTGWGILFEIRAVYFVYRLKVAEVREENGCLNDVIKSQAFRS